MSLKVVLAVMAVVLAQGERDERERDKAVRLGCALLFAAALLQSCLPPLFSPWAVGRLPLPA